MTIYHYLKTFIQFSAYSIFIANSSLAFSQTEDSQQDKTQWYQVEIFIFANTDESAANNEKWPQNIRLKYPKNIVTLIERDKPNELKTETGSTDSLPDLTSANNDFAQFSNNKSNNTSGFSITKQGLQSSIPVQKSDKEEPFILLTDDQLVLTEAVRKIQRRKNFRTLFHGAWRQPEATRKQAPHIVIGGGDQFDNHFELEGTLQLGVERYLHITTDLWLSSFVSNVGLEENPWPRLPRRPNPTDNNIFSPLQNSFLELFNNQFSVDRTITLRQTRRMRSDELHYIDHPLIGMLVKVVPYERPNIAEKETGIEKIDSEDLIQG